MIFSKPPLSLLVPTTILFLIVLAIRAYYGRSKYRMLTVEKDFLDPQEAVEEKRVHKDAHGNVLNDGDTVTLIKDLKVKGSSLVIKGGTKIKNIRDHVPHLSYLFTFDQVDGFDHIRAGFTGVVEHRGDLGTGHAIDKNHARQRRCA